MFISSILQMFVHTKFDIYVFIWLVFVVKIL